LKQGAQIASLRIRWKLVVTFTPQPPYCRVKDPTVSIEWETS
jgi:hypothetical protein